MSTAKHYVNIISIQEHKYYYSEPEIKWCCKVWFSLASLFNGISTLFRLFNAKAILQEEQLWYYLIHSWEDKGVHTFPKGICPKVNVIARLEYELAYYDSAVHRFNHYTTKTPPDTVRIFISTSVRKNSDNAAIRSVELLYSPRAKIELREYNREKCVLHLMATQCTTIVLCYSPINANEETGVITFYNELYYLVGHISKHTFWIICRDLTA